MICSQQAPTIATTVIRSDSHGVLVIDWSSLMTSKWALNRHILHALRNMAILDISSIKHHLYVILYEVNEQDFAVFQ